MLLEPKEVEIDGKIFLISKFPAMAGRKIVSQYPITALPKVGDYEENEKLSLEMMNYVGVMVEGNPEPLRLSTRSLVDNHAVNWERVIKLEAALMGYNCSFFENGSLSTFLENILEMLPDWIAEIVTLSLARLSALEKQHTLN